MVAYELPPETAHFVNREEEQAYAFGAVEQWRGRSRPLCLALTGPGGSGKTELAHRIARVLRDGGRDRDPDGDADGDRGTGGALPLLHIDLDEYRRDGTVDLAEPLGQLLGSLGVEPQSQAAAFPSRCRQYWTLTSGRRMVLVLDNARYGSEVVPLLPASGRAVVIVTSHGPLYDLEDGAAVGIALPPLTAADSADLLRRVAHDRRLAAEPDAVRAMVELCSGLPAALHVAGRWVRKYPLRPLGRLLAELRAELDDHGVPPVERVWDAAYRGLGPESALLYRLLAVHPGPSFTPASAAALLGRGPDAAGDALEELAVAGLLDARDLLGAGDGRLRLPELMRGHARRQHRPGGDAELADGRRRVVRWYLRQAQRADAAAAGTRLVLAEPVTAIPGAPDVPLAGAAAAYRWLESERHALHASVTLAHGLGLDTEAWALCEPLWTHYLDHPHPTDTIDAFRTGVAAASRAGHVTAQVRMRCQLARPLWENGRIEEAAAELDRALAAVAGFGDSAHERKLAASAREFRGMLQAARGDWAAAAADFARSREVHRALPNPYGVLLQTYRLGEATAHLGDLPAAADLLAQAHESAAELGRERMTARTGFALGGVLRGLGRPAEARPLYEAALASARARGAQADEVRILDACAELAEEQGRPEEAAAHRGAARRIRERKGLLG